MNEETKFEDCQFNTCMLCIFIQVCFRESDFTHLISRDEETS